MPIYPDTVITATTKTTPAALPAAIAKINGALEFASLNSSGGQPARLANLSQANVTETTNHGAQNAVANQQAMQQLGIAVLGRAVNRTGDLGPLEARASVEVLTGDEVAQAITDLQAALGGGDPGSPSPPFNRDRLRKVIREVRDLIHKKPWLCGHGTLQDPFHVEIPPGETGTQFLYVLLGTTIAFVGIQPDQLNLSVREGGFVAT